EERLLSSREVASGPLQLRNVRLVEKEDWDGALPQYRVRHRAEEELPQDRLAVCPHHYETGVKQTVLLQDDLGGRAGRLDRVGQRIDLMETQEGDRLIPGAGG